MHHLICIFNDCSDSNIDSQSLQTHFFVIVDVDWCKWRCSIDNEVRNLISKQIVFRICRIYLFDFDYAHIVYDLSTVVSIYMSNYIIRIWYFVIRIMHVLMFTSESIRLELSITNIANIIRITMNSSSMSYLIVDLIWISNRIVNRQILFASNAFSNRDWCWKYFFEIQLFQIKIWWYFSFD